MHFFFFFHLQSLMIFLFLVSTSTFVLTADATETSPPTNADEQVSSSSSSPAITSVPSNSSNDSIDNSKDNSNSSSSSVSECPPDHSGEHRSKDSQYEDYPSFDSADRPYFGRVRLPDDTLYLAGLQLEPTRTMNNLLCVELAMVVVFGLILAASNYINTRRQKCYYAKIHAAWGVVHGGGGGGGGVGGKAESASIGTTAAPKKKSSISAQPR